MVGIGKQREEDYEAEVCVCYNEIGYKLYNSIFISGNR